MFISSAYAQGVGDMFGGLGGVAQFLPLVMIFGVFYFLLIRPQQQKQKEVQAMIATESQNLSSGTTASGSLARITAQFGSTTARAASMHEGDSAMLDHLDGMRQAASGVSVDEELVNMQKAQRAYEAVTRVIKTADEMLNTLMSIKP